ncbi:Mitochondrial 2-oxodicarboxylate carrier [Harpegnathos saltator]|uniref:Mitochondrial 2-oxodicarboxylate carrier n=1 Tax=Harpegnathos saltator TaxID=610380 RepID=E2BU58_HARSA|nr:Mitochondrial 2-oxodicarboxylate carrier [Harpegnathos saltator]
MHPMDLVKTRFQLQVKTTKLDPSYYTGIYDCMNKMYKTEGLPAFWKGILPPIIVETPKRAVKFFTFEQYKQFFLFGASAPTPLVTTVIQLLFYEFINKIYTSLYHYRHFHALVFSPV